MQDAFKALDTDGTGITEAQLRQLLLDLGSALTSPDGLRADPAGG